MMKNSYITLLAVCAGLLLSVAALSAEPENSSASQWRSLTQDGLHDPEGPGIKLLQEPAEALSQLSGDVVGNRVNWVRTLDKGYIDPRVNLHSNTKEKVLYLDVIRRDTGEMNWVRFPHRQHTEWLDCTNCHEWLFKSKAGATKFSMYDILKGEFCGRCHGAVAFPLTQCNRCHSVPLKSVAAPAKVN
jgi:c(7)-type cytochrome triheme protein